MSLQTVVESSTRCSPSGFWQARLDLPTLLVCWGSWTLCKFEPVSVQADRVVRRHCQLAK